MRVSLSLSLSLSLPLSSDLFDLLFLLLLFEQVKKAGKFEPKIGFVCLFEPVKNSENFELILTNEKIPTRFEANTVLFLACLSQRKNTENF